MSEVRGSRLWNRTLVCNDFMKLKTLIVFREKTFLSDHFKTFGEFSLKNLQPPTSNLQPATTNRFYSPLVLNIAASEGVSMSELEYIPGTGNEGRVTKKDILQYVQE